MMRDTWTRNVWTSAAVLAALFGILLLVLSELGLETPEKGRLELRSGEWLRAHPLERVQTVLAPGVWQRVLPLTNEPAPFHTVHFVPPPAPDAPPPAQPPPRRLEFVYLGFYQTAEGARQAFVQVGEELFVGSAGSKLEDEFTIEKIELRTLTLSNGSSETYVLEFNSKKTLELPSP